MFCAGLLLSIADLLTYQTAYRTLDRKPRTKTATHFRRLRRQSKLKTTACSRGPSAQPETRGDIRWPRFAFSDRKHDPQAPVARSQLRVRYGVPRSFSTANCGESLRSSPLLPILALTQRPSAVLNSGCPHHLKWCHLKWLTSAHPECRLASFRRHHLLR